MLDGARARTAAALAALGAALGVASGWGFSVDDALIATRVAHHLALGLGHRFNPDGPEVDCVTPLGWAHLLAPWSAAGAWEGLQAARWLGAVAWVAAAACLGAWTAPLARERRHLLLLPLVLALSLPLGAWASAGLETGLVLLLATLALGPDLKGAAFAGLAAALRPELIPWALAIAHGGAWARREPPKRWLLAVLAVLGPPLAVALVRAAWFGRPAPLAVFAKPSDFEHGLRYALGALLLSGPPWLLAARGWGRLERRFRALAAALAVHAVVLVGVGGDWMPLWRLALPAFPGLLLVAAALAQRARPVAAAARGAAFLACSLLLHVAQGRDVRGVVAQRERLMAELRPHVTRADRVASVDAGWIAAATGAHLVDLSGVTDESVAVLPGGHTSKRLPRDFLRRCEVDALVLLLEPEPPGSAAPGAAPAPQPLPDLAALRPWRSVERRVLTLEGADRFAVVARLALTPRQDYVVLRRSAPDPNAAP